MAGQLAAVITGAGRGESMSNHNDTKLAHQFSVMYLLETHWAGLTSLDPTVLSCGASATILPKEQSNRRRPIRAKNHGYS